MDEQAACKNTDRELWREREGDYYAPSLFLTEGGGIGMDVGGHVIVMPVRKWHKLACVPAQDGTALVRQFNEWTPPMRADKPFDPNEIAANLVEAWHKEFFGLRISDWKLGELQRRIATALVGEPRVGAEQTLGSRIMGHAGRPQRSECRTAGSIPATGANSEGEDTLQGQLADIAPYYSPVATAQARIKELEAALHKIANDAYTREDERLTSSQPMMIWQLVARKALSKGGGPAK